MPKYIAKQSIGHFMPGNEIKGLEDKQLQALLASGAIEEEKVPEQPKADGAAAQLASLAAEVAELKAKAALWNNEEFKKEFITPYAGISVPVTPSFGVKESATLKGTFDGIEFWVYDATYRNKGQVKRFIPKDYFSLISDTNGSVAHCKIKNMLANGVAQQYFDRQWYCEDPSGIMLMTESAPLVVPSNKNGVVGGTGFITL